MKKLAKVATYTHMMHHGKRLKVIGRYEICNYALWKARSNYVHNCFSYYVPEDWRELSSSKLMMARRMVFILLGSLHGTAKKNQLRTVNGISSSLF